MLATQPSKVIIRLPPPHKNQQIFFDWKILHPAAQCLVAPCGTKVGKTYGAVLWMLTEALSSPGLYCAWIAPTYLKCRIAYRYMKAMLPDAEWFDPVDGRLEIRLANGSYITFLHGRDAEVTVEGEAVDRYVIDEAGKINKQVWYSLLTTITQTRGYGIVTGTPRSFNWYYKLFKQAKAGDDFFAWAQLKTEDSPYVQKAAVERAKRLLPPFLFNQYYLAMFVSQSSTFGDLSNIWDESIVLPEGNVKFWKHPDIEVRNRDVIHGVDIAKQRDYTVFYSVNDRGTLAGYCRFRHVPYTTQALRLKTYVEKFFHGDNLVRFDATGVGKAFADIISETEINASITPVNFTNRSKSEMVTRMTTAIESGWHKAPRIEQVEHEFGSYELKVTKSGLHSFSAPDGEHDDIVSAAMLSISSAFQTNMAEQSEIMVEQTVNGSDNEDILEDELAAFVNVAYGGEKDDDFFDTDVSKEDDFEFDFENA